MKREAPHVVVFAAQRIASKGLDDPVIPSLTGEAVGRAQSCTYCPGLHDGRKTRIEPATSAAFTIKKREHRLEPHALKAQECARLRVRHHCAIHGSAAAPGLPSRIAWSSDAQSIMYYSKAIIEGSFGTRGLRLVAKNRPAPFSAFPRRTASGHFRSGGFARRSIRARHRGPPTAR
jgi:hypothetical protein